MEIEKKKIIYNISQVKFLLDNVFIHLEWNNEDV